MGLRPPQQLQGQHTSWLRPAALAVTAGVCFWVLCILCFCDGGQINMLYCTCIVYRCRSDHDCFYLLFGLVSFFFVLLYVSRPLRWYGASSSCIACVQAPAYSSSGCCVLHFIAKKHHTHTTSSRHTAATQPCHEKGGSCDGRQIVILHGCGFSVPQFKLLDDSFIYFASSAVRGPSRWYGAIKCSTCMYVYSSYVA